MKIKCLFCDAMILPETAERNGGLCARCATDGRPVEAVPLFVRDRVRRFGKKNPEVMNLPFWFYMIGYGGSAYGAYDLVFGSRPERREHPIWCFRRFGQSRTEVPAREIVVLIGGEHEDSYDDDFCIYNDVVVMDADSGGNTIYGYPRIDFAPTDFHSATLVGDEIFIVGGLGYGDDRKADRTPVYRLDLSTMRIDYVPTYGDKPGWIWKHNASYDGDTHALVVSEGEQLLSANPFAKHQLQGVWELDLATNSWSKRD